MLLHLAAVWCVIAVQTLAYSIPSDSLERRLQYLNLPIVRLVDDGELTRENFRRFQPEERTKRYDVDELELVDPNSKRAGLKRLAILSARGFGRK
ncbi:hypothetical protein Q1695_001945 [Nippostrongylus brasiliensis]|nr:hypothetical protein Q1695_001945 [Nippostrongylus brasiliensis]